MANANFEIIREVQEPHRAGGTLCLQWGTYHYDNGSPSEDGYRHMWRDATGNQQPFRAGARIPSAAVMFRLIQRAIEDGWFITCEGGQDLVRPGIAGGTGT